jgi:DNA-directed RNA polymerase specialized sigma24 family protein
MMSSFSLEWTSELDRLEAMAVLLSAVEKGSLSGAARELHMPVSTLGSQTRRSRAPYRSAAPRRRYGASAQSVSER